MGEPLYPLMKNNISREDLDLLIEFLKSDDPILTQSVNVAKFEEEWSYWLGIKYSVFVNSGASANYITMAIIKEIFGKGEVIVPPLTWVSDIAAVLQNGFKPVFVDIDPYNLCMSDKEIIKKINKNTKAVFLTHVQGFNGLTEKLISILKEKNIPLIEDVCESHGAKFKEKKLGTYGLISNFSFYYAHHMSTIEGGILCTDNKNIYEMMRMFRSHGMVRESFDTKLKNEFKNNHPDLNPSFIFAFPAFNMRNTEIGAVIGRNQLKRIDNNNKKRNKNLLLFLDNIDKNTFQTDFLLEGCSNYAFPLILKNPDFKIRDELEERMSKESIEYRRGNAGGGNQMRQPYLSNIISKGEWKNYPNVEHVHHFGWYIGNYPEFESKRIINLCDILNNRS